MSELSEEGLARGRNRAGRLLVLEENRIQDLEVFPRLCTTGVSICTKYDNHLPTKSVPFDPVLHVIHFGRRSTSKRPVNAAPTTAPSNATVVNFFCVTVSTFCSLKRSRKASL